MSASVIGRADADADVGDRGVPGVVKLERYGRWSGRTVWLVPHSAQDMRKTEHSVGCTVLYIYICSDINKEVVDRSRGMRIKRYG